MEQDRRWMGGILIVGGMGSNVEHVNGWRMWRRRTICRELKSVWRPIFLLRDQGLFIFVHTQDNVVMNTGILTMYSISTRYKSCQGSLWFLLTHHSSTKRRNYSSLA